jgi:hypothetical protein
MNDNHHTDSSERDKIRKLYFGLESSSDDGKTASLFYRYSDPVGVGFDAVRDALISRVKSCVGDSGVSAGYGLIEKDHRHYIEITLRDSAHSNFRFLQERDDIISAVKESSVSHR